MNIYKLGKNLFKNKLSNFALSTYFKTNNLLKYKTTDFFSYIEFQTITTCNRKCSFCPVSFNPQEDKLMSMELIEKLLAELKSINYSGWISPHLYGEPLLDKRLVEIVSRIRKYLPNAYIVIYSNGDLMFPKVFRELVKNGADKFIISQYDDKKSNAMKELFNTIDKNEKNLINYTLVNDESILSNRGGLVDVENQVIEKKCDIKTITLHADGQVVMCANDYFGKNKFGDLNKEKLLDIWFKPNFVKLRKNLRKGIFQTKVCKNCKNIR